MQQNNYKDSEIQVLVSDLINQVNYMQSETHSFDDSILMFQEDLSDMKDELTSYEELIYKAQKAYDEWCGGRFGLQFSLCEEELEAYIFDVERDVFTNIENITLELERLEYFFGKIVNKGLENHVEKKHIKAVSSIREDYAKFYQRIMDFKNQLFQVKMKHFNYVNEMRQINNKLEALVQN